MAKTSSIEQVEAQAEVRACAATTGAASAAGRAAICASSPCAASASARTRTAGFIPGITKASW